jgi:thymidylate synthase (FAD)
MARYNEIEIGRRANYTIAAVEQSEDGSYWMISVKNSSGVLEFNRLFIRDEEFVTEHEVGSTIELVPWTMPIIPIKRPNRNGEIRTLRSISGLAFSETEAQSAALRNMQNLYDQAVEIANSEETRRLAKKNMLFVDFVDRDEFVDRMIKLGHGAMLEHGTIYLKIDKTEDGHLPPARLYWSDGNHKKYTRVRKHGNSIYVTTNLRVIVENNRLDDLQYQVEPTEHHEKRITAKFICDRGVSHEFVRHRVFSFAQESQRYCNYNKDKFNNELTFIKPTWLDIPTGDYTYWDGDWCDIDNMKIQLPSDNGIADNFLWCLNNAGMQYRLLINKGLKPQEARAILPNATKTELVMTGFESDWEHFFELRCSGAAHPDAKKLADELKSLMNVKNIELNSVK